MQKVWLMLCPPTQLDTCNLRCSGRLFCNCIFWNRPADWFRFFCFLFNFLPAFHICSFAAGGLVALASIYPGGKPYCRLKFVFVVQIVPNYSFWHLLTLNVQVRTTGVALTEIIGWIEQKSYNNIDNEYVTSNKLKSGDPQVNGRSMIKNFWKLCQNIFWYKILRFYQIAFTCAWSKR